MTKGGLGRGLASLISEKNMGKSTANVETLAVDRDNLPLSAVIAGKFQPRTLFNEEELADLAESIRNNGIVQPIIVRESNQRGLYEIIAGERRWRASKMVGLNTIPVIIMDIDDKQALEIAIIENVQRQNLTILEEAEGYKRLIEEFDYTQEELSDVIGKSRSQITNTLRLLSLPDGIKTLLNESKLSAGHARALLTLENAEEIAKTVVKKDLSVRQTEKLVYRLTKEPKQPEPKKVKSPSDKRKDEEIIALEKELSKKLALDLTITNEDEHGQVIISYHSLAELDAILRRLES